MYTIKDTIEIQSDPASVWSAVTDVENWPQWTPTVTSVERIDSGPFGLESVTRVKQPGQRAKLWRVIRFDEGHQFAWQSGGSGLQMEAAHIVRKSARGAESLISLRLNGRLAPFLAPLLYLPIRLALKQENAGLKSWCEAHL